ncbi:hypothetical protein QGM71_03155 [Virgibacillus sp. C22-A2]|uniref:Uncharacterized protein n=1 Tax=Virgibacillus tibetensis TaxID=3042313 RepID=A0ABU6KC39_9BACI|nr:hypothetical protein [Virgibacillus sp. C22-A2]
MNNKIKALSTVKLHYSSKLYKTTAMLNRGIKKKNITRSLEVENCEVFALYRI